jgi:hypothetical protein
VNGSWSVPRSPLKRLCAFVDVHRDEDVQMGHRRDDMRLTIGRQIDDVGLTVDINDHLREAIGSLRSRA